MSSPDPTRVRKRKRKKQRLDVISRQALKRLTIAAAIVILGVFGVAFYFLRQTAARMNAAHQIMQAESDCAAQVPKAVHLITQKDAEKGLEDRVTGTANHYNQATHRCYVEVTTYEHEDSAIFTKILLDVSDNAAVLWSISGAAEDAVRRCFAANATALTCNDADKKWKEFMTE